MELNNISMLHMAKQIIDKGNELGDAEIVSIGMTMLEKYTVPPEESEPLPPFEPDFEYVCDNCQNIIPFDKPERKKCPNCKKHTLRLIDHRGMVNYTKEQIELMAEPDKVILNDAIPISRRASTSDFSTQIRKTNNSRVRYNESGEPEGMYARTEQIEGVTNVWSDDKTEGFDEANEKLKAFTKVSPRTRKPVRMMEVVCENCKTKHQVHPIHAGGRGRFLCDKCIRRRSKI